MWNLIPRMGIPPSRLTRYCCKHLKENNEKESFNVSGVRWDESDTRKNRSTFETLNARKDKRIVMNDDNDESRNTFETCQIKDTRSVHPIIDWTDDDVWNYIHSEHIPYNPLYDCGYSRVGCVGCPLKSKRLRLADFARYPTYQKAYIRAFDKMLATRKERLEQRTAKGETVNVSSNEWKTGEEVFHWWTDDGVLPGQMDLLE